MTIQSDAGVSQDSAISPSPGEAVRLPGGGGGGTAVPLTRRNTLWLALFQFVSVRRRVRLLFPMVQPVVEVASSLFERVPYTPVAPALS